MSTFFSRDLALIQRKTGSLSPESAILIHGEDIYLISDNPCGREHTVTWERLTAVVPIGCEIVVDVLTSTVKDLKNLTIRNYIVKEVEGVPDIYLPSIKEQIANFTEGIALCEESILYVMGILRDKISIKEVVRECSDYIAAKDGVVLPTAELIQFFPIGTNFLEEGVLFSLHPKILFKGTYCEMSRIYSWGAHPFLEKITVFSSQPSFFSRENSIVQNSNSNKKKEGTLFGVEAIKIFEENSLEILEPYLRQRGVKNSICTLLPIPFDIRSTR